VERLSQVHNSYISADSAVKYRVIAGANIMIKSDKLSFSDGAMKGQLTPEQHSRLVMLAESEDSEAMSDWIDEMLQFDNVRLMDPQIFFRVMREILDTYINAMGAEYVDIEATMQDMYGISSLSMLRQFVKNFMREIVKKRVDMRTGKSSKTMAFAKDYIMQNYSKDIALTDVAEFVHLNPNYLSSLFKNETSVTFMNYLQSHRIEAAKRLLRDTTKRVSVIASEVGYRDTRHFAKLFKKFTNLTPKEYRKLNT
jgi:two-component system response regulator YesN